MRKALVSFLSGLILWTGVLNAQTIKIATDENIWYPYSYEENGEPKGLHIDLVIQALADLGLSFTMAPVPWKRALALLKAGRVDAIVSASYKLDRAEYAHYPPDAATSKESEFRITQVEYSIVTHADNPYEFTGDVTTLPAPVRAPRGYSVVSDLQAANVMVHETPGDMNSYRMMLRDKKGCIVTLKETANFLMKNPPFSGKFRVNRVPLISKSYFLVFSKKGAVSPEVRQRIWNQIKKVRQDKALMDSLLQKYNVVEFKQ